MIDQIEISGIIPWNDVFYKECNYNPLFTAITYLGGSVLPFLSNDIFYYVFKESKAGSQLIVTSTATEEEEEEIIAQTGILFSKHICNSANVIKKIKELLAHQYLVFFPVDRYFLVPHPDNDNTRFYKTMHTILFFLAYGYTPDELKVILATGNNCITSTIAYDQLLETIEGYIDNFARHRDEIELTQFSVDPDKLERSHCHDCNKYREIFFKNALDRKEFVTTSINMIEKIIAYYDNWLQNNSEADSFLQIHPRNFLRQFNHNIFNIRVRLYQIVTFFNQKHEQLINLLKKIDSDFNIIKGYLVKQQLIATIKTNDIQSIINAYKRIFDYETAFNDLFYAAIQEEGEKSVSLCTD